MFFISILCNCKQNRRFQMLMLFLWQLFYSVTKCWYIHNQEKRIFTPEIRYQTFEMRPILAFYEFLSAQYFTVKFELTELNVLVHRWETLVVLLLADFNLEKWIIHLVMVNIVMITVLLKFNHLIFQFEHGMQCLISVLQAVRGLATSE